MNKAQHGEKRNKTKRKLKLKQIITKKNRKKKREQK